MRIALLALLLLAGCSGSAARDNPSAYRNAWDRFRVQFGLEPFLGYACTQEETERDGTRVIASLPYDQCYRFNASERIEGIWIDEFEGQELLTPGEYARYLRGEDRDAVTWLEMEAVRRKWAPAVKRGDPEALRLWSVHGKSAEGAWQLTGKAYRIRFVGRRASYPGSYGHLGVSRHLVLVDKLEALTPLSN